MVEILPGSAVTGGREDGGGCGADEDADHTVRQGPICSVMGCVRDQTGDLMG